MQFSQKLFNKVYQCNTIEGFDFQGENFKDIKVKKVCTSIGSISKSFLDATFSEHATWWCSAFFVFPNTAYVKLLVTI